MALPEDEGFCLEILFEIQRLSQALRVDVAEIVAVLQNDMLFDGPFAQGAHGGAAQTLLAEIRVGQYADIEKAPEFISAGSCNKCPFVKAAKGDLVGHFHISFLHLGCCTDP